MKRSLIFLFAYLLVCLVCYSYAQLRSETDADEGEAAMIRKLMREKFANKREALARLKAGGMDISNMEKNLDEEERRWTTGAGREGGPSLHTNARIEKEAGKARRKTAGTKKKGRVPPTPSHKADEL
jgi:hypothetical protein